MDASRIAEALAGAAAAADPCLLLELQAERIAEKGAGMTRYLTIEVDRTEVFYREAGVGAAPTLLMSPRRGAPPRRSSETVSLRGAVTVVDMSVPERLSVALHQLGRLAGG